MLPFRSPFPAGGAVIRYPLIWRWRNVRFAIEFLVKLLYRVDLAPLHAPPPPPPPPAPRAARSRIRDNKAPRESASVLTDARTLPLYILLALSRGLTATGPESVLSKILCYQASFPAHKKSSLLLAFSPTTLLSSLFTYSCGYFRMVLISWLAYKSRKFHTQFFLPCIYMWSAR